MLLQSSFFRICFSKYILNLFKKHYIFLKVFKVCIEIVLTLSKHLKRNIVMEDLFKIILGFAFIAGVVILMKWVGAWMLGITNVLDAQKESLKAAKVINDNLVEILKELKNK